MSLDDILRPTFMMLNEMENEYKKCMELVSKEPESEKIRRIVIRSIFSLIEGRCYRMKLIALLIGRLREREFSKLEIAMINEETYYLNDRGEPKTRSYYPTIKSNLKFAFKIFARVLESDFELDIKGVKEFQEAIDIRHRITHPKGPKHLNVSQDDFNKVTRSYDWFLSNMIKLFEEISRKKRERTAN